MVMMMMMSEGIIEQWTYYERIIEGIISDIFVQCHAMVCFRFFRGNNHWYRAFVGLGSRFLVRRGSWLFWFFSMHWKLSEPAVCDDSSISTQCLLGFNLSRYSAVYVSVYLCKYVSFLKSGGIRLTTCTAVLFPPVIAMSLFEQFEHPTATFTMCKTIIFWQIKASLSELPWQVLLGPFFL